MSVVAIKSNPSLWNSKVQEARAKMGGKHSARAMQLATRLYQAAGGGYKGNKTIGSRKSKMNGKR